MIDVGVELDGWTAARAPDHPDDTPSPVDPDVVVPDPSHLSSRQVGDIPLLARQAGRLDEPLSEVNHRVCVSGGRGLKCCGPCGK